MSISTLISPQQMYVGGEGQRRRGTEEERDRGGEGQRRRGTEEERDR